MHGMGDAAVLHPRTVDVLPAQSEDLIEGVFPRRHAAGHHDHCLLPSAWSRPLIGAAFLSIRPPTIGTREERGLGSVHPDIRGNCLTVGRPRSYFILTTSAVGARGARSILSTVSSISSTAPANASIALAIRSSLLDHRSLTNPAAHGS